MESCVRTIAQYCRSDRSVTKMYIGIASGENAFVAMQRRYDCYKYEHGINEMISIYTTSSDTFVRQMEAILEQRFREHALNINRRSGGGGRRSEGPYYYVYLALARD
jgi:hypothetical protein